MIPEHPIIFRTEMIQAYQKGLKNQTRRTRGLEKINQNPDDCTFATMLLDSTFIFDYRHGQDVLKIKCPYGKPGDLLWFRERWAHDDPDCKDIHCGNIDHIWYYADEAKIVADSFAGSARWHPSIHMSRWASRYNPPIISTIPQRVQDITPEDVAGEGITIGGVKGYYAFRDLIKSINGDEMWDKNFWVWRIEFPFIGQK
jgi:hypothetical protein